MDEKTNPPNPGCPPSTTTTTTTTTPTPSHTTLTNRPSTEDQPHHQDPEANEEEEKPTFAPLRPPPSQRRLSLETISTLRRERSNNGWGCDDLEEDAAGAGGVIAPYNHPAAAGSGVEVDPYEVGWEGGDADPLNPRGLPVWRKWVIVGITSVGSFCV